MRFASRIAAAAVVVAFGTGSAAAQSQGGPLRIVETPTIVGEPVVGATLTAAGGAWSSPQPQDTQATWEWWICPTPALDVQCRPVASGPTLMLAEATVGQYLHVRRLVEFKRQRVVDVTQAPSGPVGTAAGTPSPAATPPSAATPPPVPVPTPTFDTAAPIAAPAPVTDAPPVSRPVATRRVLSPFPVVRMRGRLTYSGARVSILSVRAPLKAKVAVRCSGTCPVSRWTAPARNKTLTRLARFERDFDSGTRITILVTRKGYVGKRTTFVIRRGRAPRRSDVCVSDRGRVTRCP